MNDSSEDVNDFLLRIRELGDKRDREDEERTRKLEEEILQGRKERQARRAERARSISPTKDSPLSSVVNVQQSSHSSVLNPPLNLKPSGDTDTAKPASIEEPASSVTVPQKTTPPSTSRELASHTSVEEVPSTQPETNSPSDANMDDDMTPSRAQISRALGSKDPSWFRQTSDREKSSGALRKSPEDGLSEIPSVGGGFRLPGLSRNSTPEADKPQDLVGDRSRSPSRASSTIANSSVGYRYSSVSSVSTSGLGSPMPLSSQRLDARKPDVQPTTDELTPLSPGRASPERSVSPTKGLGGFVQSAMMKRSDSISKRWSVQAPGSLSRSNSVISNRSSVSRSAFGDMLPNPIDTRPARGTSPLSHSRPGSSHSEATVVHNLQGAEEKNTSGETGRTDGTFVKPSLPSHARSNTISSVGTADDNKGSEPTTPRSTSKTMDPKRWSPTKASWLESALNRPESPRAKNPPVAQQQPPWLRDLSKARQSRASVDLGKPTALKETTSSIDHDNKPGLASVSETVRLKKSGQDAKIEIDKFLSEDKSTEKSKPDLQPTTEVEKERMASKPNPRFPSSTPKISPPVTSNKPKLTTSNEPASQSASPKPGVIDFRSNLRRRETTEDNSAKEEPEFKNVFGKLRKTERSNYKAPDVFKDNIMRGKATLNATGGPKKSDRVDEFKESILKQKEAMKAGGGSIRQSSNDERVNTKLPDPVPEAISRRRNISRGDSIRSNASSLSSPSLAKGTEPESPQKVTVEPAKVEIAELSKSSPPPSISPLTDPKPTTLDQQTQEEPPHPEPATPSPENNEKKDTIQPVRLSQSNVFVGAPMSSPALKGQIAKGKLADRLNPALANILSRGPARAGGDPEKSPSSEHSPVRSSQKEQEASSGASLTHMTKGRARGPKRRLPASNKSETLATAKEEAPISKSYSSDKLNRAQIVTKKEEGPIPKDYTPNLAQTQAPTASTEEVTPVSKNRYSSRFDQIQIATKDESPISKIYSSRLNQTQTAANEKAPMVNESLSNKIIKPKVEKNEQNILQERTSPVIIKNKVAPLPQTPDKPAAQRQKPRVASKSPELHRSLLSSTVEPKPTPKTQEKSEEKPEVLLAKTYSSPEVPAKSSIIRQKATSLENSRSPNDRPTPPPKSQTLPLAPSAGNSSPSPSFTSRLKETIVNTAAASPLQTKFGLGLGSSLFPSRPESTLEKKSQQLDKVSASPPVPPKRDLKISPAIIDGARRPSLASPVPQTTESTNVISEFFGTLPNSSDRVEIDPQLILTAEIDYPKTRTIRKQIWEITGDGKKQDLPVNQEYILFEGSMYVCVHTFEYESGNRTEAYLWLGDEVSEAAMEDAQLFARRVARENGARLELVRQGKEPAKFIEALGGIIITRRGSSSRSSSSALYMLCGRRHLGQIAFDEVDLSRRNLCSGFPFVISAKFGKLYLWKGKGSGADEIGGARLIGMDLGLTGEIEEVIEGEEPESFFDVFSDAKAVQPPTTVNHWHSKPKSEKYRCRLLRVDHLLGQKGGFWNRRGSSSPVTRPNDTVEEIEPFCQKDLRTRDIYILDAFFEIYVVVGIDAHSRPAEFASALVFAHEYGILAASLQDRPFIPKSFVAIGGVPDCCKVTFRKWDSKIWASTPRILPLNAAIEAIRS